MNLKLKIKIIEQFNTQADFAQAIKEDESTISRVVRGRRALSDEKKRKWSQVLGCSETDLFQ